MRLASILTSVQDLFVLEQLGKKVRINSKIICPQGPLFSRAKTVLAKKSDKKPPKLFRLQISKAITLRTSRSILCPSTPHLVIFISGNSLIFKGHETRRDILQDMSQRLILQGQGHLQAKQGKMPR